MTILLAAAAAAANPVSLSPLKLFLEADWVVKAVMIGLLLASIWTWAIIIGFATKIGRLGRRSDVFEREFWSAEDMDAFQGKHGRADLPTARVFQAGLGEWRRSLRGRRLDRDGVRSRVAASMATASAGEIDRMAGRLNILATVGAVAPFVGLFGTVWGIMRAFTAIAAENSSSLAVVAPGIAEALFATAIGLFAAIPAVIGYNRLSHALERFEARLTRFADGFHTTLSRELDQIERP